MDEKTVSSRPTEEQLRRARAREDSYIYTVTTTRRHELLFEPYQISFQVFRTLSYLLGHPEGAMPSQIADHLLILRQTMTNVIDTIERRGLVERRPNPDDRRKVNICLLPKGYELAMTLLEIEEDYGRRLRKHVTEEEIAEFHRLEKKVYEAKVAELDCILAERAGQREEQP